MGEAAGKGGGAHLRENTQVQPIGQGELPEGGEAGRWRPRVSLGFLIWAAGFSSF